MADVSSITVPTNTGTASYDIKDSTARTSISDLSGSLGSLAYKILRLPLTLLQEQ